jgi:hypothetical protein
MPPFVRPIVDMTKAQATALVKRIMANKNLAKKTEQLANRELMGGPLPQLSGNAPENAAREMLTQYAPGSERVMGNLLDTEAMGAAGPQARNLPIEEAMATYLSNPERYKAGPMGGPVSRVMPTAPGGPQDMTGELGGGIAMERLKFKNPIQALGTGPTKSSITREMTGQNALPEVGPVEAYEKMMRQKFERKAPSPVPLKDLENLAVRLDDMWQGSGGARSSYGEQWRDYRKSFSMQNNIKTPKDYFISSAVRYKNDPAQFAKRFPREKKLLDRMAEGYKEETGLDIF